MLKDIPIKKVEDIAIAITPVLHNPEAEQWEVYLINLQAEPISDILVSSKGHGNLNGEEVKTSVLRHYFEQLGAVSYLQIELIQTSVFALNNEYMITYKQDGFLFDKRYVFQADTIKEDAFTDIPILGRAGIMIS